MPASALLPEIPILAQTEELLQWCPLGLSLNGYTNRLDEDEIDKFVLLTKSVGTFARALDTTSSLKQPSLHQSAASASRDITIQHAMNLLHESNYDIGKAALSLVSGEGPVLCRDEGEEWSIAEANLFEDALDKYGKDFNEIRKDYVSRTFSLSLSITSNSLTIKVTMEIDQEYNRILLHMEDYGQIFAAQDN